MHIAPVSSKMTKSDTMDLHDTIRTYRLFSGSYDIVFGPVFHPGRKEAVRIANDRPGQRILEVGVGTGISLPDYDRKCRLFGVDISEGMLRKAEERVRELGLSNVEGLAVMDAENLSFPDASFDVIVAQYVITTVPNPESALNEFARVLKPGGEIILVSRIGAEAGLRRTLERWFAPAARRLGWRTEFAWARYMSWAQATPQISLIERRAMPPLGHFSLIRFGKHAVAEATGMAHLRITASRA